MPRGHQPRFLSLSAGLGYGSRNRWKSGFARTVRNTIQKTRVSMQPAKPLRPSKRQRTQLQLVGAAFSVFAAKGVADATIQEIATAAQLTTATFYNHFKTKADIVEAVSVWLAQTLCRRIAEGCETVQNGTERLAIGCRAYFWLAETNPVAALVLLDIDSASPRLRETMLGYVRADLHLAMRQKTVKFETEVAALDIMRGAVFQAMRNIALRRVPPGHGNVVTRLVLRGLGVPFAKATAICARPLPNLSFEDAFPRPGSSS